MSRSEQAPVTTGATESVHDEGAEAEEEEQLEVDPMYET